MKIRRLHNPKRVFVGIKLPDELAESFVHLQGTLGDLPGRCIPPKDIHLTLVPPFENSDVPYIAGELRRALKETHLFALHFLELDWGPDQRRPRLAWVKCGTTKELVSLKKLLLETFEKKEKIPFIPHMTILRLKKINRTNGALRPIRRPVKLSTVVESVELFESPHQGGLGYRVLESVRLQPKDDIPS